MQLYLHQQKVLDENKPKWLLAMDMGTGKSLTAIELAKKNNCQTVLLICPKSLKEKWKRDLELHFKKNISYLILSKEEFSKQWKSLPMYTAVIVDEAHFFSGMTSKMSKNLTLYLKTHKPNFIWLLTATPYMSTPWNIYVLARHLGKEWSYITFRDKFFTTKMIFAGRDPRTGKAKMREVPQIKEGIEEEIALLVNKIGTTIRIDECADVPEQVFENEYFKLNPKQIAVKKQVLLEESNPIVLFTKYHQIECGTLKGNDYVEDVFFDTDKDDRILDIVANNKKVAVVCRYNLQIKKLAEKLKDKKVFQITGEVKNRDGVVQQVEASDECVVLINASCSEGYELPSVGVIVFASLSFSYKDYKQICGRFLRINKLKKNVYIHLITTSEEGETVDQAVFEAVMKKQDFSIEIFAEKNRVAGTVDMV